MKATPRFSAALRVSFVVEDEEIPREGLLLDVRARSARLTTRMPPELDRVVALRLRSPEGGPVVAARVVRRDGGNVWLEIVSERRNVLSFWEGLVSGQDD